MNESIRLQHSLFITFLKYKEVFKVNASSRAVYLPNLLFQSVIVLFRIWIFAQLYKVTYEYTNSTVIGGLTVAMAVWSLTFVQSFQTATRTFFGDVIEEDVRSGSIAYSISKPYSYIFFQYTSFLGRILPKLITNVVIASVVTVILIGYIHFSLSAILAGMLLLFLGYTLDFALTFIVGLSSFWVEDISAFKWLYSKGGFVFGGVILPLSLFPDNIRTLVEFLPFAQLYYASARMLVHFEQELFFRFLITQLFWIAVFWFIASWLFKKGVKNVAVNGG